MRGPSLVLIAALLTACAAVGEGRTSDAGTSGTSLIPVPAHAPQPTEGTGEPCPAALIDGELVADDEWGIALKERLTGQILKVIWPFGFAAQQAGDQLALLNTAGEIVAHEGDQVRIGGGQVGGEDTHTWWNCDGSITVVGPP
jgi:hypothetical protein